MYWNNIKSFLRKISNLWVFCWKQYHKYKTIRGLLDGIGEQPQIEKSKEIVFNTVKSTPIHRDIELFLAFQLAKRGATIKVFVDDGELEHWDYIQSQHLKQGLALNPYYRIAKNERSAGYKTHMFFYSLQHKIQKFFFEAACRHDHLQVINYSEALGKSTEAASLSESDRKHALSSVKRFFETGVVDLTDEKQQRYYKKSLKNCLISKKIGSYILNYLNPDLFISSHGIYSTWGPCYDHIKKADVTALIWELHFGRSKKIILIDDILQQMSRDSDWQQKREKKLTLPQKKLVNKQFSARLKHKANDTKIYFKNFNGHKSFEDFDFAKDKMVYGLFPNVVWDGDIHQRNTLFNHLIDWIEFTIDAFKDTDDILVIRFHPAETTFYSGTKKLEEILLERNNTLKKHENIIFISSDADLNTYAFAKQYVDIGLIYSGHLALELTHLNIPVISCANSFYYGAGFCFEPQSKKEYLSQLQNGENLVHIFKEREKRLQENLNRFAYWYFYKAAYEMPILAADNIYEFCYEDLKVKDVDPATNVDLSGTINKILNAAEDSYRPAQSPVKLKPIRSKKFDRGLCKTKVCDNELKTKIEYTL